MSFPAINSIGETADKQHFDNPIRLLFNGGSQQRLSAGHNANEQECGHGNGQGNVESANRLPFIPCSDGHRPNSRDLDDRVDPFPIERLRFAAGTDQCLTETLLNFRIRTIVQIQGHEQDHRFRTPTLLRQEGQHSDESTISAMCLCSSSFSSNHVFSFWISAFRGSSSSRSSGTGPRRRLDRLICLCFPQARGRRAGHFEEHAGSLQRAAPQSGARPAPFAAEERQVRLDR